MTVFLPHETHTAQESVSQL